MNEGSLIRLRARLFALFGWLQHEWSGFVASRQRGPLLEKLVAFGFLILATALEATGDAVVRMGLNNHALAPRLALFAAGAAMLFGYGVSLNLAPLEFGRVVGLYIATLFVMFQIVNYLAFRTAPTLPVLIGGALIVAGGLLVSFWEAPKELN